MYLYIDASSILHKLHPVSKLAVLILLITIPFVAPGLTGIVIVFAAYVLVLLLIHGTPNLAKFWKLLIIFWIATFVVWIVIPHLRKEAWTLEQAAILATRIISFVIAGLIFVTVTRIEEFTRGLTAIGVPYKGAFALSLGFRLVPLFYQNLRTIVDAQKSRGVDLDSAGLIEKARLYLPILSILISYGLRNTDLMAMSLEAKGFGFSSRRTSLLQARFHGADALVLISGALVIAVLAYL